MKEKSTEQTKGKKKLLYYVILAVSVLLLTAAVVLTVYFISEGGNNVLENPPEQNTPVTPDQPDGPKEPNEPSEPSGGEDTVKFVNPLSAVSVTQSFGFHENKTLGYFGDHTGVDIKAEAGSAVVAMADGKIESVTREDLYLTEIVVDHGDGLKTVYCLVDLKDGLKAGDSVKKGQQIATVADGTKGAEYKDGAHLHLEVLLNGKNIDPTAYLTLEEK